MPELPGVAFLQRLVQFIQQGQPRRSDADADDAAIVSGPIAFDQSALLEFVEQARDVRRVRDEPAGEIERGNLGWVGAAQEPQGVVLLGGEVMLTE